MTVQRAPIAVTFAEGVDTRTDQKQVAVTKLVDLQNCVFTKASTLTKRAGYAALPTAVDNTQAPYINANGLGARGDELVLFANALSYSYRPSTQSWSTIGPVSSVVASASTLARTGTQQTAPDMAVNGGVIATAWVDNAGGVWCSAVEQRTMRILLPAMLLDAAGVKPRCVAVGTVLHVLWANGALINCAIINPAKPNAAPMVTTPVIDLQATTSFDVVPTYATVFQNGTSPAMIAWGTSTGVRVGYLHASGVLGSPITGLTPTNQFSFTGLTGPIAVACDLTSATAALMCFDGTLLHVTSFTPSTLNGLSTLAITPANTSVRHLTLDFDGTGTGSSWYAIETFRSGPVLYTVTTGQLDNLCDATSTPLTLLGHSLASHAFNDGIDVYVAVTYPVLFYPYVIIIQLSGKNRGQSRLLPGLSAGALPDVALPSVSSPTGKVGDRIHLLALGYRIQLDGGGTQFGEQGTQLFTLDFDHGESYRTASLGAGLYLAGSLIQHYDGSRWAEADFHCAPDTSTGVIVAATGTGGSLTLLGTYGYRFVYEEIDAQGEIHPGPPSVPTLVTLIGSGNSTAFLIPTYRLTSKNRVRIGVFRSLNGDQSRYFRVSSVSPTATGYNGYVLNDPTVDTVSFGDNLSDAAAALLEPLYTNGGILGNDPAPSKGDVLVSGKTRLFWTDPLDPDIVRYSQTLRDDTACESPDGLTQLIPSPGGTIVSLAVMDDNVIVFKETSTYAFSGPGPDSDGGLATQASFSPTQLVTSDVGCLSPASICNVPTGVVFQSKKGIYLLGRDIQVNRIGDPVFAYNGQNITRATLAADLPHVYFLTDSGRALLYDYSRDQWSTFTNHQGYDAALINGVYYYLRTDGRVFVQTAGAYSDGGAHIPMLIRTAWIKATGYLQGWQKILRAIVVGEWESVHTLRMRYLLNYEPALSAPNDKDVTTPYTPDNYGAGTYGSNTYGGVVGLSSTTYQSDFHINKRCQAIAFQFEDIEPATSFGASFQLTELLLIGGVLGPAFKPGATRQA